MQACEQDASQAAALLAHCEDLSRLLLQWNKQGQDVQDAVVGMVALIDVTPRIFTPQPSPASTPKRASASHSPTPSSSSSCKSPKKASSSRGSAKILDFSNILGVKSAAQHKGRDLEDIDPALDDDKLDVGSPSASSDGIDLDVDETWAKRMQEFEKALDAKDERDKEKVDDEDVGQSLSVAALLLARSRAPSILSRIDEGSNAHSEDEESPCTSTSESDEASEISDVELAWASVPEVGCGVPAQPNVQPDPAAKCTGKRRERRQKDKSSTADRSSAYVAAPANAAISEVPASFRTKRRLFGPKDHGPLSRLQSDEMDTE